MRLQLVSVAIAALFSVLLLPSSARAQDGTAVGTVTDATNAVLPGVTVTALRVDSGNTSVDVTDASGAYRLSLRPGVYKLTAELAGFTPAVRDGVTMQVGQRAEINLQMKLSTVTESVTVTGAAPMVNTSSSEVGGVIDRRQVEDLPINGRNFVDLSMLAPGSRSNSVVEAATPRNNAGAESQLNVDGQQVTQLVCCQDNFGNPRYSKDAIAEFEVVTNRFDATQGHSSGFQLNAITKSGTNRFAGSAGGYFRHDKFNAQDLVAKRVLPYQDQQVSLTFGGPIIKDKLHFFANYEYERTPQTYIFTTPYPSFNKEDLHADEFLYTSGLKIDYQLSAQTRAMFRLYRYYKDQPVFTAGGSNQSVSSANAAHRSSDSMFGALTQTFGSRAVNEIKGGYNSFFSWNAAYVDKERFDVDKGGDWKFPGAPRIDLNGIAFGGPSNLPQRWIDVSYQVRDDLTLLYTKAGRHEFKVGGELLHTSIDLIWLQWYRGQLIANNGPIPTNIEQIIPNQYDWHTWNLAALSPVAVRWQQSFGNTSIYGPSDIYSGWFQDNWAITPRLTVNAGVRYEFAHNQLNEDAVIVPFLPEARKGAKADFSPRFGGAYNVNGGKTVFRGGFGKYIAQNDKRPQWGMDIAIQTRIPSAPNDGRANFAADPYNGRTPTLAEVFSKGGDTASNLASPDLQLTYSWQGSAGVQHQINDTTSFTADYVWQGGRKEFNTRNMNLTYDANGVNFPTTNIARRSFPGWGIVQFLYSDGDSDYKGLQTAIAKRFSKNWQANATYTLAGTWDRTPCGVEGLGRTITTCPVDIGGERTLAVTDQRHRATVNGIWSLPYDLQLSGVYFYGSGARLTTVYGGDRRLLGFGASGRLGPNGVIAPRNGFVGNPLHRVDLRLLKKINLGGQKSLDGIIELFNVFNHENFGSYTTNLSVPANYGRPQQNANVAYAPRIMQLGFRFAF